MTLWWNFSLSSWTT